jgi:hypothetical protein
MLDEDVAFLLQDMGSSLTATRPAVGTYNPSTGIMSGGTTSTYVIRGVFINYEDGKIDGTVIRMGDRRLLAAARGATGTPAIGDRVGGLEVVDVRTIAPQGVAIAWACQVRK